MACTKAGCHAIRAIKEFCQNLVCFQGGHRGNVLWDEGSVANAADLLSATPEFYPKRRGKQEAFGKSATSLHEIDDAGVKTVRQVEAIVNAREDGEQHNRFLITAEDMLHAERTADRKSVV